ncbi:hypothetical protein MTR67_053029 [Solanum verrucosum]|uniref:Chromo domain-containing protein n=1 Tax=Solanum verrucosum TaxID=315347 RepID=A0AAF1A3Z2_SOLVR|nr:hypothetical protein MTR67_053029 [Solanum verrucosum]
MDRDVRKLRTKEIKSVKVQWKHRLVEEATWETDKDMRDKYPQLLDDSAQPPPVALLPPPSSSHLFSPCSLPSLLTGENGETNRRLSLVSPISESSLLCLSLNCSGHRAPSNQHQQPARRATTSPAN